MLKGIRNTVANLLQSLATRLASVTVDMKVGDLDGWTAHQARPNDRSPTEIQQLYQDALTATRKNPLAKSIVNITTDFIIGGTEQLFVNLELLRQGFAAVMIFEPNSHYRDRFEDAETDARAAGTGLWGVCGGPDVPLDPVEAES